MKQIIEEVLQAEKNVSAILKDAREKAVEIKKATEKQMATDLSRAKEKAQEIAIEKTEAAKKESETICEEMLKTADKEKENFLAMHSDSVDTLVNKICSLVTETVF